MQEYNAIEKIGFGKRARFCVRHVVRCGKFGPVRTYPLDLKAYATIEAARAAAAEHGFIIEKEGDAWQII